MHQSRGAPTAGRPEALPPGGSHGADFSTRVGGEFWPRLIGLLGRASGNTVSSGRRRRGGTSVPWMTAETRAPDPEHRLRLLILLQSVRKTPVIAGRTLCVQPLRSQRRLAPLRDPTSTPAARRGSSEHPQRQRGLRPNTGIRVARHIEEEGAHSNARERRRGGRGEGAQAATKAARCPTPRSSTATNYRLTAQPHEAAAAQTAHEHERVGEATARIAVASACRGPSVAEAVMPTALNGMGCSKARRGSRQ